ncbi:hypothetical protein D7Z26_06780 [Cohnella endophytica]|uniref:Uncharacterized protein n=1 Tax=Cohnella endophytica TaxID=2419778 RepID=A0A494XYA2_9BACL|nr:hypothetical protein [Cohnella endophytica]RKP54939.1 hypothetical protein D7Z26_06780 [Cohnella endophytica]
MSIFISKLLLVSMMSIAPIHESGSHLLLNKVSISEVKQYSLSEAISEELKSAYDKGQPLRKGFKKLSGEVSNLHILENKDETTTFFSFMLNSKLRLGMAEVVLANNGYNVINRTEINVNSKIPLQVMYNRISTYPIRVFGAINDSRIKTVEIIFKDKTSISIAPTYGEYFFEIIKRNIRDIESIVGYDKTGKLIYTVE